MGEREDRRESSMVKEFLYSQKKIYDPIHGFIRFDDIVEKTLIDSIPMQRLHNISQLGVAYLVYPGATNSRFAHSLGVMELATLIYKRICKKVRPDLFDFLPMKGSVEYVYWKRILRIACLCHDFGHLPFSHAAENDILEGKGHEYWTLKIIQSPYLKKVWQLLKEAPYIHKSLKKRDFVEDVMKIAIGEEKLNKICPDNKLQFSNWERVLSNIITGDFFGADRMDYLLRDAKYTGVAYGLFDYLQLIESLRLLPNDQGGFELGIDENGLESCEALFLARHFMFKRVYLHPSIKAFSFHLRRAMKNLGLFQNMQDNVDKFLSVTDAQVTAELMDAAKDKKSPVFGDAKKIVYREAHYKAIPIEEEISEEEILNFKKKNNLKDDELFIESLKPDLIKKDVSFLVSRRYFAVEKAKNLSTLFESIAFRPQKYVYIAPEYEQIFLQAIKQ